MIYGMGIDIVGIKRIEDVINRNKERFLKKIFTDGEINYCNSQKLKYHHYAGRIAVKEAMIKALGRRYGIDWREMEVKNGKFGQPKLNLYGKAIEIIKKLNIVSIEVSISHCDEYAIAAVILEK
ncbi:MAG: holo-ACP synthase [bacterium]